MIEVNIVGTGNVAWHLARAFAAQNQAVLMQVAGRTEKALEDFKNFTQSTTTIDKLEPADVTIIAVSDDVIKEISEKIPYQNALVVHTSGFTDMSTLSRKHKKGVFYPLQSFSKDDAGITFDEIPILIEAEDEKDLKTLQSLATIISDNVQVVKSDRRKQIHLAAVFANNFTNHCYKMAQDICDSEDISFDILHPLIKKTAQKALDNGPKSSQTGPAKRGDTKIMSDQIALLNTNTQRDIYKLLSKAITSTYGKKL